MRSERDHHELFLLSGESWRTSSVSHPGADRFRRVATRVRFQRVAAYRPKSWIGQTSSATAKSASVVDFASARARLRRIVEVPSVATLAA